MILLARTSRDHKHDGITYFLCPIEGHPGVTVRPLVKMTGETGFNEVAIGMATPIFLLEFARERISKRQLLRATVQAEIYTPDAAVDAGFLDRIVDSDEVFDVALSEAERLAVLPRAPYLRTRSLARTPTLALIEETLEADIAAAFPG